MSHTCSSQLVSDAYLIITSPVLLYLNQPVHSGSRLAIEKKSMRQYWMTNAMNVKMNSEHQECTCDPDH